MIDPHSRDVSGQGLSRRVVLVRAVTAAAGLAAMGGGGAILAGCSTRRGTSDTSVTLYTSTDSYLLPPIIEPFEERTGIKVRVVGDTEATKTFGLVQRLLSERDRPVADVWWSNEILSTLALAEAGVLAPFDGFSDATLDPWPATLRGDKSLWHGFALRARCLVINPARVTEPPRTLRELTDPKYRGRVGLARPQFGTTRTHVAALVAAFGERATGAFFAALKANEPRLYDGNSAVVRGVEHSEIDIGLTDTDDVLAAKRNGSPVELVLERRDDPAELHTGLPSRGPLVIPNTVALVGPVRQPDRARSLAAYLLSAEVEKLLAESDSRNTPVRPEVAAAVNPPPVELPVESFVKFDDLPAAATVADGLIEAFFPIG